MKQSKGFTLVEVMIVLVIIGILSAISIPAYTKHVTKTKRAEGKALLLEGIQRQERRFTENMRYAVTIVSGTPADATEVSLETTSANGHYVLSLVGGASATAYTLQAVPQGTQLTNDTGCGTLTLSNTGVKGISGTSTTADCWR
jgi:type IV pilus assembly protein PilE